MASFGSPGEHPPIILKCNHYLNQYTPLFSCFQEKNRLYLIKRYYYLIRKDYGLKKVKRILAWVGIIIIAALYITSLVLGICGNENTFGLFKLSLTATIVVPVLIWAYNFIYNLLKRHGEDLSKK